MSNTMPCERPSLTESRVEEPCGCECRWAHKVRKRMAIVLIIAGRVSKYGKVGDFVQNRCYDERFEGNSSNGLLRSLD